jgi:hypothetical protein
MRKEKMRGGRTKGRRQRADRGAAKSENQMRERSTERKPPTSRSPRCGCRAAGAPTGR